MRFVNCMMINKIKPSILCNRNTLLLHGDKSKIPDVLVYSQTQNMKVMADTRSKSIVGRMYIELRDTFAKIEELYINPDKRKKGYGKKFLDFAQNYSRNNGRNGNLRLLAGALGYETKSPHAFYRKYGFTSSDKERIAVIDSFIKNNKELPELYPTMSLYYEPTK